jgi:hypothetical protein
VQAFLEGQPALERLADQPGLLGIDRLRDPALRPSVPRTLPPLAKARRVSLNSSMVERSPWRVASGSTPIFKSRSNVSNAAVMRWVSAACRAARWMRRLLSVVAAASSLEYWVIENVDTPMMKASAV